LSEERAGGTVTILFTDLDGSTDLRNRLGDDASQPLFDDHEMIVRREVLAYGGREVKALGDGFMVAFGSARQALGCAVAIQRAFQERNRADPNPGAPHPHRNQQRRGCSSRRRPPRGGRSRGGPHRGPGQGR
jgi:class 3 adenylate cyclase